MNSNGNSALPATTSADPLTILREVSDAYETLKTLRKRAARAAQQEGHTYQELGEALGINRSNAYKLIHRDAA
jgi:DNA-directed RNA polymerase specialized sigma24 family protein